MCWAKAESSTSLWAGGATTQPGPEPSIGYGAGMLAPASAHLRMRQGRITQPPYSKERFVPRKHQTHRTASSLNKP
jgi:hypothetical protein